MRLPCLQAGKKAIHTRLRSGLGGLIMVHRTASTQRDMKRLVAVAATIALILTGGTQAADWPTKPVKIVVACAAGEANDLLVRVFAGAGERGVPATIRRRPAGGQASAPGRRRLSTSACLEDSN
jgi:hypothetical protein